MGNIRTICLFCGSSKGNRPEYLDAAYETGAILARKGLRMVYGGGNVGLMGMAAKGALENGGKVTGVITEKLKDMEVAHPGLTEMKVLSTMHERKAEMNRLSDAFLVLPGGIGTIEETFEMFTAFQLGDIEKPIGFLNTAGFYSGLMSFLEHVVSEGFLREEHLDYLIIEEDPLVLIETILKSEVKRLEKWFDRGKHLVE